jgi:hypothetical protein
VEPERAPRFRGGSQHHAGEDDLGLGGGGR